MISLVNGSMDPDLVTKEVSALVIYPVLAILF